jgi:hypothetical protein
MSASSPDDIFRVFPVGRACWRVCRVLPDGFRMVKSIGQSAAALPLGALSGRGTVLRGKKYR